MASRGVNKAILIGNVGHDPEVKHLNSGVCVASVSLATSETWQDKASGEKKEKTEWHRVSFVGKIAEIVGEWVKKGSQIYVEGKIQTRKWQDQSGQDRYSTEIVVDSFSGSLQLLGGRPEASGQQQPKQQKRADYWGQPQGATSQQGFTDPAPAFDDDIPF